MTNKHSVIARVCLVLTVVLGLSPAAWAACGGASPNLTAATSPDLVACLAQAQGGDTITLTAGVTYDTDSSFVLRNHGSPTPITITSSALASLPAGQRVSPTALVSMPLLRSTTTNTAVFLGAPSAGPWTLQGLAITSTANRQQQGLIELGNDAATAEAHLAHDIVVDRCYLFGLKLAGATGGNIRGIHGDAVGFTLRDSYLSDFKYDGADSQALFVQQGTRQLILNNYLEGAGENIIYGGSITSIDGQVPADIQIVRNTFHKPPAWNLYHPDFGSTPGSAIEAPGPAPITCTGTTCTSTGHGAVAGHWVKVGTERRRITAVPDANTLTIVSAFPTNPSAAAWTKLRSWSVKNLLEFKIGERIRIEGNLFDGNWPHSQDGRAIVFTPRSSSLNTGHNPWARVRDVVFRHNWVRNVTSVFNILGHDRDDATPGDASSRTVKTAGPGTISTTGATATFTVAHGLAVGDIVRLMAGPRVGNSREVIAVPTPTTATLRQEFRSAAGEPTPQTDQPWDKWSVLVTSTNFLFEHNVFEDIGKGQGGYYFHPDYPPTSLMALLLHSPTNITFRHLTVVYTDEAAGAGVYLGGDTGGGVMSRVMNLTIQDNLWSNGAYPFYGDGNTGNAAIAAYTGGTVVIRDDVFFGTLADPAYGPPNNAWPTDVTTVGFESLAQRRLNLVSGPYRAGQASPASDGTDRGANIAAIGTAMAQATPPPPVGSPPPPAAGLANILTWVDNATNELGTILKVKTVVAPATCADATPFTELARVGPNVVTYTHTPVLASTIYCYVAVAYNAAGEGPPSNVASRTVPAPLPPLPPAPSGLSVTGASKQ